VWAGSLAWTAKSIDQGILHRLLGSADRVRNRGYGSTNPLDRPRCYRTFRRADGMRHLPHCARDEQLCNYTHDSPLTRFGAPRDYALPNSAG